jgi:alkylhydroperoxidase family enzyme
MPRVPLVPDDSTDPVLAPVFDVFRKAGRDVPELYRALGNAPRLLQAWVDFAWPLRNDATTPRALRELAILRVAQLTSADYEWRAHLPMALRSGVTPEQVDELSTWQDSERFGPEEHEVLRFVDELTRDLEAGDDTMAALLARWSPAEVVELVLTVSFYSCVSRVLRGLGLA